MSARLIDVETSAIKVSTENIAYSCNNVDDFLYKGKVVAQDIVESKKSNTKFSHKPKNKKTWHKESYMGYWGWGLFGVAYNGLYRKYVNLSTLSSYFFGRHGNVMGWGWEIEGGGSFGKCFNTNGNGGYVSATAKFFPYKFLYLAVSGNLIGINSKEDFLTSIFGISLLTGIDYYISVGNFFGAHYGIGAGITYMPTLKTVTPTIRINLSFGLGCIYKE
jgi:hypothetical protein